MKSFALSALCILVAGQESPVKDQMKGVKTCTECVFEVDLDDRSKETLVKKRTITYGEQRGDIIQEVIECRGEARFVETYMYAYDDKGRKMACAYWMDGALRMKSTFTHAVDGGYSEARMAYEGKKGEEKSVRASSYDYNPKGLLIGEAHNSARGPADPRIAYAYDAKDRLTEKKMFFVNSPFPEVTSYSYEEQKEFLTKTVKDEEGSVLGKVISYHNEHGDPLMVRSLDKNDKEYDRRTYEYAYDSGGRILIKKAGRVLSDGLVWIKHYTYTYELFEKK